MMKFNKFLYVTAFVSVLQTPVFGMSEGGSVSAPPELNHQGEFSNQVSDYFVKGDANLVKFLYMLSPFNLQDNRYCYDPSLSPNILIARVEATNNGKIIEEGPFPFDSTDGFPVFFSGQCYDHEKYSGALQQFPNKRIFNWVGNIDPICSPKGNGNLGHTEEMLIQKIWEWYEQYKGPKIKKMKVNIISSNSVCESCGPKLNEAKRLFEKKGITIEYNIKYFNEYNDPSTIEQSKLTYMQEEFLFLKFLSEKRNNIPKKETTYQKRNNIPKKETTYQN